jgi:hypothetical protein
MMRPPRLNGATALRRVLESLDLLAGGLLPVDSAGRALDAVLADPLERLFAPPPGERTLAQALAALDLPATAPAPARGRRAARPALVGGSPAQPAAGPFARWLGEAASRAAQQAAPPRSTSASMLPAGLSALFAKAAPPAPSRTPAPARSRAGARVASALEAFARRVVGGEAAASSRVAPAGIGEALAQAISVAAATAVGVGEVAQAALPRPLDAVFEALSKAPAGAATHRSAAPARPPDVTTLGGELRDLAAASAQSIAALVPDALGGAELEAAVRTHLPRPAEEQSALAAAAMGGQLGLLVRRWQGPGGEHPAAAPRRPAPAPGERAYADTDAFARTLERVLTAEARRHGIKVESG